MKKVLLNLTLFFITFFSFEIKAQALSNIILSSGSLNPYFNEKIYKYNVFLDEPQEININATLDLEDDYILGTGVNKLVEGENEIKLTLYKKDGNTIFYTLKIFVGKIETTKEPLLKKLSIEGYNLNFESKKYNYFLNIENEEELKIKYEPYSDNVKIKLTGNSNLKYGNNKILITVSSVDEKTKNIYEININKTQEVFQEKKESEYNKNFILNEKDKTILKIIIIIINLFLIYFLYSIFFLKHSFSKKVIVKNH